MFVLQIPSTGSAGVMPRTTPSSGNSGTNSPTTQPKQRSSIWNDPWGGTMRDLERNRVAIQEQNEQRRQETIARGATRRDTIVGRVMTSLLGNELTYNDDGSYSRPNDTGKYYYQADGSIFYAGGTITTPDGREITRKPQTLRNPNNITSRWDESSAGSTPLAGTFNLNKLDLVPDGNGAFIKPGAGNTGRYFLQPDGSIFYEGGQAGGKTARAQTYNNGTFDTAKNTATAGTNLIQSQRLIPTQTPYVFRQSRAGEDTRYVYVLPDGRLLWLNSNPVAQGSNEHNIEIFENNNWRSGMTTNSPAITSKPEFRESIRALLIQRDLM